MDFTTNNILSNSSRKSRIPFFFVKLCESEVEKKSFKYLKLKLTHYKRQNASLRKIKM